MVFTSPTFLFVFLPVVLVIYFLLAKSIRAQNLFLLLASLFFYAWGESIHVLLMIISIVINYLIGYKLEPQSSDKENIKLWLAIGVIINLSFLVYFKYLNFFIESILSLSGDVDKVPDEIHLPIGISFFTFQSLSYLIDLYRKKYRKQESVIKLGLYISFFPQLIAGPIVRYTEIRKELSKRKIELHKVEEGISRFILGLAKKIIIANNLGYLAVLFSESFDASSDPFYLFWFIAICRALQIYYDFSGYSDMAIGLGKVMGFKFPENFDYPYSALSIREFWRKWHITLSFWFRDYLYIPLGGNRISNLRTNLNLFLVFLLTGLWHGANWTFIFWGLFHGVFLLLERNTSFLKNLPKFLKHIYVCIVLLISWILFFANDLPSFIEYVRGLTNFSYVGTSEFLININYYHCCIFIAGIILAFPTNYTLYSRTDDQNSLANLMKRVILILLLLFTISEISTSSFNPFIYFRF